MSEHDDYCPDLVNCCPKEGAHQVTTPDTFRVRTGRSYQRWTMPDGATPDSWNDMLNGVMGLNKLDPEKIAGFRIQVNFKKEERTK